MTHTQPTTSLEEETIIPSILLSSTSLTNMVAITTDTENTLNFLRDQKLIASSLKCENGRNKKMKLVQYTKSMN